MERKNKQILVRVTETQKKEIQNAATRATLSMSGYLLFLHNAWKNRKIN